MQNNRNGNAVYYFAIIIITLFFGCSMEQSHKTLTFFFDGVDKVYFFNDYLSNKDSLNKESVAKREALLKRNRPEQCVHQPYKEKKCDECHTPDKRLLMPMPGLCFRCHQKFNEKYAVSHGPVASGNCLSCHNQHSSKYPKLLIRQGQQLCLYCHNSSLVFANKVHRDIEDASCTLCHNPHGGKTRFMVKDNISRDANRIALMDELTYRHLYGQIYCKIPGDVNNRMEIYVRDSRGILIATIHPDDNGKFYLSNLHPDQNYIFSFKKDVPDCKINVMDNNGAVLFVFAKDKMEKYVFDKDAYETVHTAINDAHFLGDTLKSTYAPNDHVNIATVQPEVKNVASIPSVVTEENIPTGTVINKVKPSEDHQPPVTGAPDKIIVETLPGNVNAGELIEAKRKDTLVKQEEATGNIQPSIPPRKSHIIVTTLADTVGLYVPPANEKSEKQEGATVKNELAATSKKSKIIVTSQPDMGNTDEKPRRAELDGATLMDMSLQMSKLYQGTVVCVVNDSADYSDIASVNPKGEFLLQGFLSYKLTTPYPKSGIISQTVFINDKMQIIETINKRISNGRYVYSQNSQEKTSRRAIVKIIPDKNNYELASTIYFDRSQAVLPPEGRIQLDKLVESISENQKIRIYLVAHADVNGSISPNKKLAADRSTATIEYLVSKGIKRTRITGKGYSSTKPIYQLLEPAAISEESRKRRRVDIFIKEN